jgi:single-stranded DNA-specific DHH superfamily exonuclease
MSAPEIARGFRIMSLAKRMKNIIPDMVFALFAKESPMELRMEMLGILEDKYELFLDIADRASDAMLAKIDPRDKIIVEIAPAEIVPSGYIGMSGTLASRIMSRLKKPAIIFVEDCDGTLKGSWRTGEINGETLMRTIAAKSPGILEKFGGHAPAGGLLLETRKRFSTFKFLVQDELESLRVVPPKEWYDNPNVRKYFSTISRDSKAFVVEEFDRIWLLAPFNRYDVKRPSVFVTNVLVENIETTGNEKLLRFIDGAGHSVEVSLGEDTTTEIKDHSVVDLLLVLSILTPDSFGYSSELVIPSQFRMQG